MILSENQANLYYELWLPLVDYINQKCDINRNVTNMADIEHLNHKELKEFASKFAENLSVIDEYLMENQDLSEEHREIMEGWKKSRRERFVIERHLKDGSIFISAEDDRVYQVCGIKTSLEDMFCDVSMPVLVEATLMPFGDVIIADDLIVPHKLYIGGSSRREFKEKYMRAKMNEEIIRTPRHF